MPNPPGKRIALHKLTLTKSAVEAMKPRDKPWTAWDDKLIGFGVQVQPTGAKSFLVNYRTGGGGRKAPNKRVVLGRFGRMPVDEARRLAHQVLGKAAGGDDPAIERARARDMPVLEQAFEDYMAVNPKRAASSNRMYRAEFGNYLGDWRMRPLDAIARRDVEDRFNRLTRDHGWSAANRAISLLRSVYRRPCVDLDGLRNPVDLWLAGGGEYHAAEAAQDLHPGRGAAALACRYRGPSGHAGGPGRIPVRALHRHAHQRGAAPAVGARRHGRSLLPGRGDQDGRAAGATHHPPTGGHPRAPPGGKRNALSGDLRGWVFPSTLSGSGHIANLSHLYARIGAAGGAKFWYHGLRNCFITVAERDLLLPRTLTKRLVNHARPSDITEGYAADWTIGQLRGPAQRIADRIEGLMNGSTTGAAALRPPSAAVQTARTADSRMTKPSAKTRCAEQAVLDQAHRRDTKARRKIMDRLGRQTDRVRRPGAAHRPQVLHRQLPRG